MPECYEPGCERRFRARRGGRIFCDLHERKSRLCFFAMCFEPALPGEILCRGHFDRFFPPCRNPECREPLRTCCQATRGFCPRCWQRRVESRARAEAANA